MRERTAFQSSTPARFHQRYDAGLTLLASNKLGKSMDAASAFFPSAGDPNFPQDSNNLAAQWGRSNFDIRHRLSVSVSYQLPSENRHLQFGARMTF